MRLIIKDQNRMYSFAFLVHIDRFDSISRIFEIFSSFFRFFSKFHLKQLLTRIPPFILFKTCDIKSLQGCKVRGLVILLPLLPDQFVGLDKSLVHKRVKQGIELAVKNNINIISLGGFTSIVTNQGEDFAKYEQISITTGNTLTASFTVKSIIRSSELLGLNLDRSTLMVIGATGDIGSAVAVYFIHKVKKIVLSARDLIKLNSFAEYLKSFHGAEVVVGSHIKSDVAQADFVVTSTSATSALIDVESLKSGAVVCDISVPPNVAQNIHKQRKDILVYSGGYAQFPFSEEIRDKNLKKYFPFGSIFGCFAEVIILSMEKRFENFSFGRGNITIEKMEEIYQLACKHGFRVAPFFCGDMLYTANDFIVIRKALKK